MMRRTERLFRIIQTLRAARPMTGRDLAQDLETSLRTLYRDIAELIAQGVPVRGEAGTGYVLDKGYDLPPLMLTPDELEAAVLGASWWRHAAIRNWPLGPAIWWPNSVPSCPRRCAPLCSIQC
jgi:predicted DNA-binding transcriptional regulator YafY